MENLDLQLYVNGKSHASLAAIDALNAICTERLQGDYRLEVIDIQLDPDRAEAAGILAVPTLIRSWPLPVTRIIGALTVKSRVLAGLGLSNL
ncbi:circadian clock KaiB family protein [Hymenobacter terricola]|uniref:circadian clock KaiB family protein n=1 Tax=Hymenobacter terricola TaxID=2819236 RepID=UPI001B30E7E4|nr:circadian clock KaiB family protein [Hymenobacter terricola]